MSYEIKSRTIRKALVSVFVELEAWFERDEDLRQFKPLSGGWSVDQVLEHISLSNHFLMLTLRKQIAIALKAAAHGDSPSDEESDLDIILVIGERGSFEWPHPEHMTPSGTTDSTQVKMKLREQLDECLEMLEQMSDGVGALREVKMSVNDLGKIDLYQWLFFLAQHARRHLRQLNEIEAQYHTHVGNKKD